MQATSTIVRARSWSDALRSLPLSLEVFHAFAERDSFADAWSACERPDYLLRVAGEFVRERGSDFHKCVVRAASACALTTLDRAPHSDQRPRLALKTLDRWCDGATGFALLDAAWRFADDSAHDCPNYAAWATRAAIETTAFSTNKSPFVGLANAARHAARIALNARDESRDLLARQLADAVRTLVPLPPLGEPAH